MVFIYIYGVRAILLHFCDHQESELDVGVTDIGNWSISIIRHPLKYQRVYENIIIILYRIENMFVELLHIYGTRGIFLFGCDHLDTELE